MKFNRWTLGLAAAGVLSFPAVMQAEEASHQVLTSLASTTLSGYVDTSLIWKLGTGNGPNAASGGFPGRAYDGVGKQDGINLNVVKLALEKPLDEGQWSAGYKFEMLLGPDARGFGTQAGGGEVAIKQAYVALRANVGNGLDLKVGVWDTPIGYEVFDSASNPNYSRSFGYGLEPTTYTGVLASYKFSDWFSASAGIANNVAAGVFINARSGTESEKTYLASVTLSAPDSMGSLKGASLSLGMIDHASGGGAFSGANIINYYAGVSIPTPLTGLSFGAAYDYRGASQSGVGVFAFPSAYANALAAYVSWQATEKLKLNGRADYTSASNGTYYNSNVSGLDSNPHNELFGVTLTSDYQLWDNVVSRLELRWDTALNGDGGLGNKPFGGGGIGGADGDKSALSVALNIVYKF